MALRSFLSLERRLQRFCQFQDYSRVMHEYFTLGHEERVLDADLNKPAEDSFYLAHHAVYKESASTPLRVVFDGSMKTTSGVSLNDQLLVGPTVYPPLNDVLIRFRKHSYVLTTDVSKMYRAPLELRVLHSWQQTRYCDLQRKMNQSSLSLQRP